MWWVWGGSILWVVHLLLKAPWVGGFFDNPGQEVGYFVLWIGGPLRRGVRFWVGLEAAIFGLFGGQTCPLAPSWPQEDEI